MVVLLVGKTLSSPRRSMDRPRADGETLPLLSMTTPDRTTAEVFPRYTGGEVLADSAALKWPGLFARRYRFPRVVDGFLVPATAEPLIVCTLNGSAEFQERDVGGTWLPRHVRRRDLFVTGSKTPYELRWRSPAGAELDMIHIQIGRAHV